MLCRKPYQQRRSGIVHPTIVKDSNYRNEVTPFPCGQCLHCRINQSREWQTRLILEAKDSFDSTFLTLTYDEDHVPWNHHLEKDDLTLFLKRYRKRLGHKIRYYAIGEYGEKKHFWRPHFHLAIFSEKRIERCYMSCENMRKRKFCTQDCIARLAWNKGNISVTNELSNELAQYITGYIKKKATKDQRINRPNEYSTMSRGRKETGNCGIGYRAIKRLGDKLKNDPRSGQRLIRSLNLANGQRPLGSYLTSILADQLGISQSQIDHEFTEYSNEILSKYLEKGTVITNLLKDTEGKRNSQIVKTKIFSGRKQL